jgi:hypothetical protein
MLQLRYSPAAPIDCGNVYRRRREPGEAGAVFHRARREQFRARAAACRCLVDGHRPEVSR